MRSLSVMPVANPGIDRRSADFSHDYIHSLRQHPLMLHFTAKFHFVFSIFDTKWGGGESGFATLCAHSSSHLKQRKTFYHLVTELFQRNLKTYKVV